MKQGHVPLMIKLFVRLTKYRAVKTYWEWRNSATYSWPRH